MSERRGVILIGGIPGVGKSTLAARLARRFSRGVHIEADLLQKMIVRGGLWPDEEPADEARRQLSLRARNACRLADTFHEAGFVPVVDDVIVGSRLHEFLALLESRPCYFALLLPSLEDVRRRNRGRADKDVFDAWQHLDAVARDETPQLGMRLDTSGQSVDESLDALWARVFEEGLAAGD